MVGVIILLALWGTSIVMPTILGILLALAYWDTIPLVASLGLLGGLACSFVALKTYMEL